jgi:hypothetical protein
VVELRLSFVGSVLNKANKRMPVLVLFSVVLESLILAFWALEGRCENEDLLGCC